MIYTVRVESGLLLNEYLDTDNTDKKIGSQKKNLFSKKEKIDSDSISLRSLDITWSTILAYVFNTNPGSLNIVLKCTKISTSKIIDV